ncbi:MAG TPA: hypothetical protein ENH01_05695 [Nitrospirae bacterium]|nr:hypothetical protein [Nitrospirota bacterium]
MIYEYALDPDLLDNWKDIRYFKDNSGAEKGRLISEYPKKWARAVFNVIRNSDCGDVEKKRMKEAIRRIQRYKSFRRTTCDWDVNLNWVDNAKAEHRIRPFRAIVAKCDNDETNRVLSGRDIDERTNLWNCDCGSIVRNAAAIATAVAPLLALSQHIKFIDPHFNPDIARFRNPLLEMLKIVSRRNNGIPLQSLEYHISNRPNRREIDEFDEELFKSDVNLRLKPNMSRNISLSFIQWNSSYMHNRYIITNVGCLRFGIGLDEDTRNADARDEIERLNDIKWAEITAKYSGGNSFYSITGELEEEIQAC